MKYISFLIFIVLFASCRQKNLSEKEMNIPRDSVISEEQLVDCMTDIFLIEAALFKAQNDGKDLQQYSRSYYDNFFKTNAVSKEKIKLSLEYYIRKRNLDNIVQQVVTRLTEIDIHSSSKVPIPQDTAHSQEPPPVWLEKMLQHGM